MSGSFDLVINGKTVKANYGETLVDANLDDYVKEHAAKHPGILRKDGHIGFQSYNTRVEFRDIYLKPL